MEKEYIINIQGYYLDSLRERFPEKPGVYFIYRGRLDVDKQTCTLSELLYIGQTDNLHRRHNEHNRRTDFLKTLGTDEVLLYTIAFLDEQEEDRLRIEAALIYEIRPILNIQNVEAFNYPKTTVVVEGNRHAFVPARIVAPSY